MEWVAKFPNYKAQTLDYWGSDHRVLQLTLDKPIPRYTRQIRPRRFEPWWVNDGDCEKIVTDVWSTRSCNNPMGEFTTKIQRCASNLHMWNKQKFGNIWRKVNEVTTCLNTLRQGNRLTLDVSNIRALEKECTRLLIAEEHYWKQRSRVEWLRAGDLNTRFFHSQASA